jgi:hypothetical protein
LRARIVLAAVLTASPALADVAAPSVSAPAPSKWQLELGLRAAYAVPYGHYGSTSPVSPPALSSGIGGAIPLTLEAGVRRGDHLYLGAGGTWGPVLSNQVPNTNVEPYDLNPPEGNTLRLVVEGRYAFRPRARVSPWVGLATGVEWLQPSYVTYFGFPYFALDVGTNLPVREPACLGPFVSVSAGRFQHMDGERSTALLGSTFDTGMFTSQPAGGRPVNGSGDITDAAWHGWIELGVRGCLSI